MRERLSTTVDADLLARARRVRPGCKDAVVIDEALRALLAVHRAAEVDAGYTAYAQCPPSEPDAWGDLSAWCEGPGLR